MIDFELTEEQKALIETARRFAQERIIPVAAECDRESQLPEGRLRGGLEDRPREPDAARPSTAAPGSATLENDAHHRGARVRLHAASRRASPPTRSRSRRSSSAAPRSRRRSTSAGSRPSRSWRATRRPSQRRAATSPACRRARRRTRGDYVLNGTKCWITNATLASFYVIFATERPGAAAQGHRRVHRRPRSPSGLKLGKHEDKLGQRASDTAPVILEDVNVPASQVLAPPGQGFKLAMETFNQTRPDIGAVGDRPHAPLPRRVRRLRQGAQDASACRSRSTSSSRR